MQYNVTSGRVDTFQKANITLGRVEVSARLQNDAASGIHTAHWLLGYGCWPQTAEIDIMECQSPHNVYAGGGAAAWQRVTSNYVRLLPRAPRPSESRAPPGPPHPPAPSGTPPPLAALWGRLREGEPPHHGGERVAAHVSLARQHGPRAFPETRTNARPRAGPL